LTTGSLDAAAVTDAMAVVAADTALDPEKLPKTLAVGGELTIVLSLSSVEGL